MQVFRPATIFGCTTRTSSELAPPPTLSACMRVCEHTYVHVLHTCRPHPRTSVGIASGIWGVPSLTSRRRWEAAPINQGGRASWEWLKDSRGHVQSNLTPHPALQSNSWWPPPPRPAQGQGGCLSSPLGAFHRLPPPARPGSCSGNHAGGFVSHRPLPPHLSAAVRAQDPVFPLDPQPHDRVWRHWLAAGGAEPGPPVSTSPVAPWPGRQHCCGCVSSLPSR